MPNTDFRVRRSPTGYCVEMWRDGEPYVTFLDDLTEHAAYLEARALTALWMKISAKPPVVISNPILAERAS